MVKKLTWYDAKNKLKKGQAELAKLEKQKEQIAERIKKQQQANREAEAEYIIQLRNTSHKSDSDLERFFLASHHNEQGD